MAPQTSGPRLRSRPQVLIAGAGLIGLSLALELHQRGLAVAVADPGPALAQASVAAAGMLAAADPHNPAALGPLARFSIGLYPAWLERIAALSGLSVPFQTVTTIQYAADGATIRLAEHSVDPRQLAAAVLQAVGHTSIALYDSLGPFELAERRGRTVMQSATVEISAPILVHASGAWFARGGVVPVKGQMLRVALPASLPLSEVHRSESIYIVPRTTGPQAGSALLGATLERVGFDLHTDPEALASIRRRAALLLPALADERAAPPLESWAGVRPATPDSLPLLGPLPRALGATLSARRTGPDQWVATGHFRNGVLLAPATASVMADLIEGKAPCVQLEAFSPSRFQPATA